MGVRKSFLEQRGCVVPQTGLSHPTPSPSCPRSGDGEVEFPGSMTFQPIFPGMDRQGRERTGPHERYGILDTPPEPAFDDIVQLAAQVCEAPVSLISFVAGDRQWFKARVGFEPCQTTLTQSVCIHALAEPGLLVIEDLTLDGRTRANPLVTGEPHLRFYAGVPLNTPEGACIGTLCVIDRRSRPQGLTEAQASGLQALARQVMVQLEMRRAVGDRERMRVAQRAASEREAVASLRANDALLQCLLRASADCIMVLDLDAKLSFISETGRRILEVGDRDVIEGRAWPDLWDGSAQADARAAVEAAAAGGTGRFQGCSTTFAGTPRWWDVAVTPIPGPDGRPERLLIVARDITDARRVEERQVALAELGDRLREVTDAGEVAFTAASVAGRTTGAVRAGYGTVDAAGEHLLIDRDWRKPEMPSIVGRHRFSDYGSYVEDLRRGEAVLIADVETDARTRGDPRPLLALGIRSLLNVPVMEAGRLVGVLCINGAESRDWSADKLAFLRSVADRTRAALARLWAEERQELLNRELSHRMKNLLAMVQSIATQTMRGASDLDAAKEVLAGRLIALGRAHDLLMGGALGSTRIEPVVREALGIHADTAARFRIAGPDLEIGAKPALSLALVLHELATNAAKYGALSNEAGHVEVAWTVLGGAGEPRLRVSWIEVDGPPVAQPSRKGFGTRFIERGLTGQVGGEVDLTYAPTGLRCTVTGTMAAFQANA